ncbi:MAG: sigma-70 family RNA polymerase sigma factor [Acidobacteria bacterium]|nr:sigma-70 family RNA polymerase sigma factor [Acidobacteriota bacterium]
MELTAAGFGDVVRSHQDMVYSIAWHYFRDRHQSEEIAQEVFLELHRNLASIESDSHMAHWLRRVTAQRCIDQTRRLRLRPRSGLESAPEPSSPASHADPLLSSLLARLVDALPDRARMAVILRYQEDMDLGEIASAMNIPAGSVKSTLHRALALLRGKLERTTAGKGVR